MGTKINKQTYQTVVDADLNWLSDQDRSPERMHVVAIVEASVDLMYPPEPLYTEEQAIRMVVERIMEHGKLGLYLRVYDQSGKHVRSVGEIAIEEVIELLEGK